MKIAAAHDFHDEVAAEAASDLPRYRMGSHRPFAAQLDRAAPEGSDFVVYAGDAYTDAFVDTVMAIAPPKWAHTEDAGTDGRFYDDMRAKGVAVTHSPGANAPEVAEFAFAGVMWGAKRLAEFRDQQRAHEWRQLKQTGLSAATDSGGRARRHRQPGRGLCERVRHDGARHPPLARPGAGARPAGDARRPCRVPVRGGFRGPRRPQHRTRPPA